MSLENFGRTISFKWLLAIYAFVPFLMIIWLIDIYAFDKALLPYMGMGTLLLPLYLLLFELPHIIASLLTFADKAYLKFYQNHLLLGLPAMVCVIGFLFYYSPALIFLIYITATAYHAIRQQTGIASMLAKLKGIWFQLWSVALIISTALTWALIATPQFFSRQEISLYSLGVFFGVVISLLFGAVYWYQAKTKIGRQYILATTLMVLVAYLFVRSGYLFFAFFVIRFVHDLTAFTFYVVHDSNRNSPSLNNSFYALFKKVKLPLLVIVPVVSIGIALVLRLSAGDTMIATAVLATVGFMHYYLESIMWKRDSLHRKHIAFKDGIT